MEGRDTDKMLPGYNAFRSGDTLYVTRGRDVIFNGPIDQEGSLVRVYEKLNLIYRMDEIDKDTEQGIRAQMMLWVNPQARKKKVYGKDRMVGKGVVRKDGAPNLRLVGGRE